MKYNLVILLLIGSVSAADIVQSQKESESLDLDKAHHKMSENELLNKAHHSLS